VLVKATVQPTNDRIVTDIVSLGFAMCHTMVGTGRHCHSNNATAKLANSTYVARSTEAGINWVPFGQKIETAGKTGICEALISSQCRVGLIQIMALSGKTGRKARQLFYGGDAYELFGNRTRRPILTGQKSNFYTADEPEL